MLEVTNLAKAFLTPRGSLPILSDLSLSLTRGEAASILGPSGSGKSTLLSILGALEPPSAGTVRLDGDDPFLLGPRERAAFRNARVGFVFQDHLLLPQCTVLENVLVPTLVGEPDAQARARALELLENVGLGDRIDDRPAALAGGEQQRVALARALIRQPLLLLCDEPTGNLDHQSAEAVASLLLALHHRKRTVLVVVTHSPGLADRLPVRFALAGRRLVRRGIQM